MMPTRLLCYFCVVLFAVLLVGGPASAQRRGDREACLGRDADAAISACTRILEGNAKLSNAERAKILVGRGAAHAAQDHRQLAIDDFTRAIETDPTSGAAYRRRGSLRQKSGDFDSAIADFTQAIARDAKDAAAYNARGVCYDKKRDNQRAVDDYGRAIEIKPDFDVALYNRGLVRRRQGDVGGAIADYDRAIAINPKDVDYYIARANAWLFKGNDERALQENTAAIRIFPDKSAPYFNRARVLIRMKEFSRALIDIGDGMQREPRNVHGFNLRGLIKREQGDLDGAIVDFDAALGTDPKFTEGYANRGEAWRLKDDLDRALADFNTALRASPQLGPALTHRGLVYEAKRDFARARDDFKAALATPERLYLVGGGWADIARAHLVAVEAGARSQAAAPTVAPDTVTPAPKRADDVAVTLGTRVALVIGNGNYRHAPRLANPSNDAGDVARTLRRLGFNVVEGIDLDKAGMEQKIREFGRKLDGAGLALFFYAGHGLQVADKNYLVPIDAKLERSGDLAFDTVTVDDVMAQMESERRTNLVILDACRDNPLTRSLASAFGTRSASVGSGLAPIQSAVGTMIVYATQPKNVALDGEGRNSPFTTALLKHIATPGLEIGAVMKRVRADVYETTRQRQLPWDHSSLIGEVVLVQ